MLNAAYNNGSTVIRLCARVDSANSAAVEAELNETRAAFPQGNLILDASDLEYISSAGLRVILRLRKAEPPLKIVNVSDEIFDIFDMTGFAEIIPVERAFKTMSVEGCKEIGRGAKGTVYRFNADTAVKVYKSPDSLPDINRERELARRAFVLGVPTAISYAIVRVGDSYGSVFELLNAKSFTELLAEDPANTQKYVDMFADLLHVIHNTRVSMDEMPDFKNHVAGWLDRDARYLTPEEDAKLRSLVASLPDTDNLLHCDFHTNNVMLQNGEAIIIDMDTLSHGHPVFELANIYIAYVGFGEVDVPLVENFMHLPYSVCTDFWHRFIRSYLGTDDEKTVTETENKIRVLSYARLVRFIARRAAGAPEGEPLIAASVRLLRDALSRVDTLVF